MRLFDYWWSFYDSTWNFSEVVTGCSESCEDYFAGDDAQLPPVNDTSIIPELEALEFVNTIRLTQVFRSGDAVLKQAYNVLDHKLINYDLYDENMEELVQRLVLKAIKF